MSASPGLMARFAGLVRLSHTLFALPFALGSAFVAAQGLPPWPILGSIVLCMVGARNGAMAFNRLVDEKLDAANPRTATRHLPARTLTRRQVILFIWINFGLFLAGAYTLNSLAFILAVPTFLTLLSYSYAKRVTWLCHYWLGVTIGLSPLGAWVAVRGELHGFPLWLGVLLALWIAGFDIIYATQDTDTDRRLGLHSIPARFGVPKALRLSALTHLVLWGCMLPPALNGGMGWAWQSACVLAGFLLLYIHLWRRSSDLDRMNRDFFLANVALSLLVLVALIVEIGQGRGIHVLGS